MTAGSPDNEVLWARGLVKSYDGSPALRGVSLGVREGEILAVAGPRGSGKTTLIDCLSGYTLPDAGEVWFNSKPVHTLAAPGRDRLRRERFGWIGTEPRLVPELMAWENVALPLLLAHVPHKTARVEAEEWLTRLDVGDCAGLRPARLLQAQRQRIAIARALVARPTVIFADEPTAPLQRADRGQVLRTLTTAARSHGITIVITTSDADTCAYADRTFILMDGRRADGDDAGLVLAETTGDCGGAGDVWHAQAAAEARTEPADGNGPRPVSAGRTSVSGARRGQDAPGVRVAAAPVGATALSALDRLAPADGNGTPGGDEKAAVSGAGGAGGAGTHERAAGLDAVRTTASAAAAPQGSEAAAKRGAGRGANTAEPPPEPSGETTIGAAVVTTGVGAGMEGANRCSASA